ncbi:MAG: hypothetical protein KDB84_12635, partial [Flavobacteriales bacterium]|nr:hypothetical protein [Flavobacteriales bacterium]
MMLLAAVVLTVDGLDHERSGLLPWLADGTKNASSDPEVGHDPFALGTDTGSGCAQGTNPDQGLRIEIGNDGMTLGPVETDATWQVGIELRRIHRGKGALTPFDRSAWRSTDSTLTIDHGTYAIEYINNSDGLRQNFIVREEPPGDGPLQVELRPQGDLECVHAGHDAFHFVDTDNVIRMRYADLHVWDAQGDTLEAFAELVEGSIVLTALDADAVYPITVDPLASTAIWTTESNLNNAQLGTSVSSAGDVNGDG